jgi:anti-anti-sigma factor
MLYTISFSCIIGTLLALAPYFEIHEQPEDGRLRLHVMGELNLASAPLLEQRLEQLHRDNRPVRLDLSRLEFMDSTGIHILITAFKHACADGWQFAVEPDLSPQVEHLFKLTDVARFIRVTG